MELVGETLVQCVPLGKLCHFSEPSFSLIKLKGWEVNKQTEGLG